jgi:serine/threonine protein kinase
MQAGQKLGPYELLSPIGAGGMGEVWKARDTRLDRAVAIKFSQADFTDRFEREARAIAALNHPNICQIYDVGPNYLVMEFVDGAPVAAPGDTRKLLDIAAQIADGLAAAHAAGFIHRDLKPDNILITRESRVKILDFGLAKHFAAARSASDATLTITATDPGTVVGTVAYMSPEQARGLELDTRSDQFSFGLILYELASGKRAFQRASSAETMAAIIREEPEPLPASVPAPLRWTIERCLAKDPGERYDSTRDLYRELRQIRERLSEATSAAHAPLAAPPRHRVRRAAVLGVAAGLAIGLVSAWLRSVPPPELPDVVPFASDFEIQTMPAWSPKGDRIAYSAAVNGIFQVFTRTLTSSTPVQMTHQGQSCFSPFWSPDGTRIFYLSGRALWSVSVAGGQAEKVRDNVTVAALSPDGKTLAQSVADSGLPRLALSSPPESPPQPYQALSRVHPVLRRDLAFGPRRGDLGFLYTAPNRLEFWRIPKDGSPPRQSVTDAISEGEKFTWLPDEKRIILADGPETGGHLALWDLESGKTRWLTDALTHHEYPALSPDGRTLAFAAGEGGYDIIEAPLDGSTPRDVIATPRSEVAPAWSPDGVHFAYVTNRSGEAEIWLRDRRDGSERLLVSQKSFPGAASTFFDCAFSPDGTRLAFRRYSRAVNTIWITVLSGEAPVALFDDPAGAPQRGPSWSPDGKWIAYYSTRQEKYAVLRIRVGAGQPPEFLADLTYNQPVRWSPRGDWIAYPSAGGLHVVSPDGKQDRSVSQHPWETFGWSKDGAGIYGIAIDEHGRLMIARLDPDTMKETKIADLGPQPPALTLGNSRGQLFCRGFSLHPDGKSFLTSMLRIKAQIYLMRDFDRPTRLIDRFWTR